MESAARILADALKASPEDLEANVLMGAVLARMGARADAIRHLRKALEIDGDCYEACVALSSLLFANQDPEAALQLAEKAIALRPQDPASYHHLARDLIAQRRVAEAALYLRKALNLAPDAPSLLQDLATALGEIGERDEALGLWTRFTQVHPRLLVGWVKLGGLYLAAKKFHEAFVCGRKAIQLSPESAEARLLIGLALLGGDGGAFEAEAHLSKVVALKPEGLTGHSAYGLALQEMGRFDEARPHFEKAIEISPFHGQAYHSLISTRRTTEADQPLLEKLSRQLEHPAASPLDRSYMRYALGKAQEDLGDFEVSMGHYDQANSLAAEVWFANRPPSRERYSRMIQGTIDTCTPAFLDAPGRTRLDSEKPLLIVGMIRSGTTLVEQILSSHPLVKGAGELPFWHEEIPKIWDMTSNRVDEAGLENAAKGYLALLDRLGGNSLRVTDKLPHNYTMLGFVLAALPNARVIYVKRHPVDNCLSIYTTAYQHPPEFTLSRSNIVFGYRQQDYLLDHWRATLPPSQILEIEYEDLIEKREEATRRMIEFAGLEWDDSCLAPEKNQRAVNTPSVWQVRQGVYKTSVARWRKFEPWLGEFRDLMPKS
jgi:tetratricopeptide (TPR) repeat protein